MKAKESDLLGHPLYYICIYGNRYFASFNASSGLSVVM